MCGDIFFDDNQAFFSDGRRTTGAFMHSVLSDEFFFGILKRDESRYL